jgi:type I restriction enzyme S subunit
MTPETFLKEFGAIAHAPGGVRRLREMILQLAVMGKLVAQNPEDESVDLLLTRIEAEKKTLIKSKIIKKPQKADTLKDRQQYLDIPASWRWVHLQTVGNIFNGNSINAKVKEEKYSNQKEGLPFIATKDVEYGFQSLNYENGVKIPINEQKFKLAHKKAVLICSEGGSAGKKCGITERDIYFGNKLYALELYSGLESKFFLSLYLSPSFFTQFEKRMTGIIGGISLTNFSTIPIPLPPLAEQKRIVAKVDQLMALCDRLEAQQQERATLVKQARISSLDELAGAQGGKALQASWKRVQEHLPMLFDHPDDVVDLKKCILQNAVMGKLVPQNPEDEAASELLKKIAEEKSALIKKGDITKQKPLPIIREAEKPFEIPERWEWCRLNHLGFVMGGGTPSKSKKAFWSGSIPWISPKDMKIDYIFDARDHISNEALAKSSVKLIPENSVLTDIPHPQN